MFKWLKTRKVNAQKLAGLAEKEESTQNKILLVEKLNKMFDRRDCHSVEEPLIERRQNTISNKLEIKHV